MKIQSKYKDYYDYLQGIYGIDDKLFLDRSKGSTMNKMEIDNLKNGDGVQLAIMGLLFTMIYYNGKWYTKKGLYNIGKEFKYNKAFIDVEVNEKTGLPKEFKDVEFVLTDLNYKYDCPIIRVKYNWSGEINLFPRLADYNFGTVIPPEDIWINLYNWLSRVKEEPNIQTDKEKIVSHGFDLKTSFRNM